MPPPPPPPPLPTTPPPPHPRGGVVEVYRARGLLLTKVEAVIGRVGPPPLLRAVAGHAAEAAARRPPPPLRRQQPPQPRRRAHDGSGRLPSPSCGRRACAASLRAAAAPCPHRGTSHGGERCCRCWGLLLVPSCLSGEEEKPPPPARPQLPPEGGHDR